MTALSQNTKRKLSLPQLADELGNVACCPHPNRILPEIEEQMLAHCLKWPTHGAQRIFNDLHLAGVEVSPSGVCGVWLRHDLETRSKRLMRLERESRENTTFILSAYWSNA